MKNILTNIINHIWYNLIIKRNEFHKSLDLDINKIDNEKYMTKLYKKRNMAHQIEMNINIKENKLK